MNNLEPNKIFAAFLVAGIVASLSGFIAMKLTATEPLKQNAYKIEGVASSGGGTAAPEKPQPILDLIAAADVAKGQQIAKVCASCHNLEKGGPNGAMAPNIAGVVGRPKASHPGFDYSDAMKKKGGDWTYEDLNQFLWKPQGFVSGTKMTFAGLKKPEDRAAVIAYLRSLSDNPPALPTADEIAKEKAELAPPSETPPKTGKEAPAPNSPANATAAVPQGNGGTGYPESNPAVKQGAKPVNNNTEKTPEEKIESVLPNAPKPRK